MLECPVGYTEVMLRSMTMLECQTGYIGIMKGSYVTSMYLSRHPGLALDPYVT
jgi:hypothetical protein